MLISQIEIGLGIHEMSKEKVEAVISLNNVHRCN